MGKKRNLTGKFPITRRRFLKILGISAGFLLSEMGYGLVAPASPSKDPLKLPMSGYQERMSRFLTNLAQDPVLQTNFLRAPTQVLIAEQVVPETDEYSISRANRLLYYLVSNKELQEKLTESAVVVDIPEESINQWMEQMIETEKIYAPDDILRESLKVYLENETRFKQQIRVLLADRVIQDLLSLAGSEQAIDQITTQAISNLKKGPADVPIVPDFGIVVANVVAVVNWKFVANVNYNLNVNLNANANANANINANVNVSGPGPGPGPGGGGCFIRGTVVAAGQGSVAIDQLATGDRICSYDTEGRQLVYRDIVRTFRAESQEICTLKLGHEVIHCTPLHRFYVHPGAWVHACELQLGDQILSRKGDWVPARMIRKEEAREEVFNLQISQTACYFVGKEGFLVHNVKKPGPDYDMGILLHWARFSDEFVRFAEKRAVKEV